MVEGLAGGIHICLAVCLPFNLWMKKQIVFLKMEGQVDRDVCGGVTLLYPLWLCKQTR